MAKTHDTGKPNQPQGQASRHETRDVAAAVAGQARNTLETARDRGQEVLQDAKESMATLPERASEAMACQMKHMAGQLREHLPQEGPVGTAAHTVADTLDSGAAYLKEHDIRAMAKDLEGVVRNHPIPALLAGIGLGFLLGRTIRS